MPLVEITWDYLLLLFYWLADADVEIYIVNTALDMGQIIVFGFGFLVLFIRFQGANFNILEKVFPVSVWHQDSKVTAFIGHIQGRYHTACLCGQPEEA